MDVAVFKRYIERFNKRDETAFDDYLTEDVRVQNGALEYEGVAGMKAHYASIWKTFDESLHVERFLSDGESVAVQMWTNFLAQSDASETPFGAVRKGDQFDYRGIIMYRLRDGKFSEIKVAYLSFVKTSEEGDVISIGIPH